MSTKDHNETLAGIHLAVGAFFALTLLLVPVFFVKGYLEWKDIPLTALVVLIVLAVALLMISTAITMHKRKPLGRELALWAAPLLFFICWPAAVYSWWFLHSDGAKQMYRVKEE